MTVSQRNEYECWQRLVEILKSKGIDINKEDDLTACLKDWANFHHVLKSQQGIEHQPEDITLAKLEVVLMPQGEIICIGKTVGWFKDLQKYLTEPRKAV